MCVMQPFRQTFQLVLYLCHALTSRCVRFGRRALGVENCGIATVSLQAGFLYFYEKIVRWLGSNSTYTPEFGVDWLVVTTQRNLCVLYVDWKTMVRFHNTALTKHR